MINALLYRKKRQQRWWRYLELVKAYQRAQSALNPAVALEGCFRKLGYAPPPAPVIEFWSSFVGIGAQRAAVLEQRQVDALEHQAQAIDAPGLSARAWLDLSRLAIGVGVYQIAGCLRSKGIECSAERRFDNGGSVSPAELALAFYSNLELGRLDKAASLLDLMEGARFPREKLRQADWLLKLFRNDPDRGGVSFGAEPSVQEAAFSRYISGSTLALVGPVPSDIEQGAEIDGHDIVVKFSYRGGGKGRDPSTQGERIDISYYNNTQAQALSESDYSAVLSQLQWAVCINRKGRRRFPENEQRIRQLESLQWFLPDTHFNAGPNVMLDLLRFHPGKLKVFNTDLMLSAGRYAGYRPEGAKPIQYTRSFVKTHDPILQYLTLYRLWTLGLIEGDQRFTNVMSMGLRSYLQELQGVHGAHEQALL